MSISYTKSRGANFCTSAQFRMRWRGKSEVSSQAWNQRHLYRPFWSQPTFDSLMERSFDFQYSVLCFVHSLLIILLSASITLPLTRSWRLVAASIRSGRKLQIFWKCAHLGVASGTWTWQVANGHHISFFWRSHLSILLRTHARSYYPAGR